MSTAAQVKYINWLTTAQTLVYSVGAKAGTARGRKFDSPAGSGSLGDFRCKAQQGEIVRGVGKGLLMARMYFEARSPTLLARILQI